MLIPLLRIYLITMILLAFGLTDMHAQTMFILKENGALSTMNVSSIKKIVFSETGIVLQKADGKSDLYNDSIIRYLNFENLKSIKSDAGYDLIVKEGDKVSLDGTISSGPFDDALMFNWFAPGPIQLSSVAVSKPTFIAPEVKADTTFVISLFVSDGRNIAPLDSVSILVMDVEKLPASAPPVAAVNKFVYPSLVTDWFTIDNSIHHFRSFRLYDYLGRSLKTGTLSADLNSLSVTGIPPGLLLLDLLGDNQQMTVKLMKSR